MREELRERIKRRQAEKATKRYLGIAITVLTVALIIGSYLDTIFGWKIFTVEVVLIVFVVVIVLGLVIYVIIRRT